MAPTVNPSDFSEEKVPNYCAVVIYCLIKGDFENVKLNMKKFFKVLASLIY